MFQKINTVIKETVYSLQLEKRLNQYKLMSKWEEVVGKNIARNATPSYIRANTLYVETSSSAWAQELNLIKKELIRKLNKYIKKRTITDIRFKATGVFKEKKEEGDCYLLKDVVLTERETRVIERATKQIGDPALREIFRRALEKDISLKIREKEKEEACKQKE